MLPAQRRKVEDERALLRSLIMKELRRRESIAFTQLCDLLEPWRDSEIAEQLGVLKEQGSITNSDYPSGAIWRLKQRA